MNRQEIQALIDGNPGGVVSLPQGVHTVDHISYQPYCIRLHSGTTLIGPGVLRQGVTLPSTRLVFVTGDDCVIRDITLEAEPQPVYSEHRHGVFAGNTNRLVLERVVSRGFTGDGLYLYQNVRDTRITDCVAEDNGRNGLTFGAAVTSTTVENSLFRGNAAQQVDSEPGKNIVVSDVTLYACVLDSEGVENYALTISGSSQELPGHTWRVIGCTINGGIMVVWANDVQLLGNRGTNPTGKPLKIQRSSSNVTVAGNDLHMTQTAEPHVPAVWVQGTAGSAPSGVTIVGNRLRVDREGSFGVRADAAHDVTVVSNIIEADIGVRLRATSPDRPFTRATVLGNNCSVDVQGPVLRGLRLLETDTEFTAATGIVANVKRL